MEGGSMIGRLRDAAFHDVYFVAGGRRVGASRLVLAANSRLFADVAPFAAVPLEGDTATLQLLLDFCHVGHVTFKGLDEDRQRRLVEMAVALEVAPLVEETLSWAERGVGRGGARRWWAWLRKWRRKLKKGEVRRVEVGVAEGGERKEELVAFLAFLGARLERMAAVLRPLVKRRLPLSKSVFFG